jgi:hypothetical protein
MASEGSQADLDFALAQLETNMTPPAPPSTDGMGADPVQQQPVNSEPWQEYTPGDPRPSDLSVHHAARELAHLRRKRGEQGDGTPANEFTDRLHYADDREVTAQEAAKDISEYRRLSREQAQKLLEEVSGQPAAQPEPAPEPVLEQPQHSQAELEQAALRQQTTEQWQAASNASADYQTLLQAQLQQLLGVSAGEFADLKKLSDEVGEQAALERLAQTNPQRFAKFMEVDTRFRQAQAELQRIRQQQAEAHSQAYAQNYRRFAEQHDKAAEQLIPEMAPNGDPRARMALQQGAMDLLKEAGYSNEELHQAWTGGGTFYLRDARAQKIIADAVRYRLGQQRMKEAIAQPHPPAQRPGVRMPQSSYSDQSIAAANKQLSLSGNIRDATRLRQLQYAQRRGE